MPELPEVETVRRQLLPICSDTTITDLVVLHPKTIAYDTGIEDALIGKTIKTIDRIGKLLIVSFIHNPDLFLLIHLKMTGQILFTDHQKQVGGGGHTLGATDATNLPHRHTRLYLTLHTGTTLFFNDMRLFGYCKRATAKETERIKSNFGPEPLDPNFDAHAFSKALRSRRTTIKAALLDQSLIAGLGNIYVDEVLFRVGIKPQRRAHRLLAREALAIASTARDILTEAIAMGGTTFQHFTDTGGQAGNFSDNLQVFGKHNTPCPLCNSTIKKIRVAGRGTHFCQHCQR